MLTHVRQGITQLNSDDQRHSVSPPQELMLELLQELAMQGYRFTTVTPATHERFLSRHHQAGTTLRDIFGWNLPFKMDALSPLFRSLMIEADLVQASGDFLKSKIRISSLDKDLFLHSAFPTTESNAVFFGPDTYRFARFIRQTLQHIISTRGSEFEAIAPLRVLDIGCGSGAGGVVAMRSFDGPVDLVLNDINPLAIAYARTNTAAAAINAGFLQGDAFTAIKGKFDLIISNPPYIKDNAGRTYRDGGARLGLDISIRIVQHAINHLAPGGCLLLYTGVAMTCRSDPLMSELVPLLVEANCHWSYEEIDPDIFGEELEQPAYAQASRIAAVGLVVTRPS